MFAFGPPLRSDIHQPITDAAVTTMSKPHPMVAMNTLIQCAAVGMLVDVHSNGAKNKNAANHAPHVWKTERCNRTVNIMGKSHME